jgi:hypothetical protein
MPARVGVLSFIAVALATALAMATQVRAQTGGPSQTGGASQAEKREPSGRVKDSVYVPGSTRRGSPDDSLSRVRWLREDARLDSLDLVHLLDSLENTPQARMRRNLAMAPSDWMPTKAERDAREADLRRAMDMDFVFPHSYVPLFGISTGAVFRALGLIEDVTPRITYTLLKTEPVTVKIYDLEAQLVATLVDGPQRAGVYDFQWDLTDAAGVRVPYGNYVAEVIVGGRMVLRKRIEAP